MTDLLPTGGVAARRPARRSTRRLALALAALALAGASGCSLPPRIEYVGHEGGGTELGSDAPFDWPRPVRLGVVTGPFERNLVLRDRIVDALSQGVDRVVHVSQRDLLRSNARPDPTEFMVDIDVDVQGSGDATNFLACFPGFVIFMPTWYQLRFDYEITTRVRVYQSGQRPRTLTLTDRFLARHTPAGISVGSYVGWGGVLFAPLLISPLVTGIVAAVDEWDPVHFAHLLAHDPRAGYTYANRVARAVRGMIDDELRFE